MTKNRFRNEIVIFRSVKKLVFCKNKEETGVFERREPTISKILRKFVSF